MSYLGLRRARIILAAFAAFAALALLFAPLDLALARVFFDGVSFPRDRWWQALQRDGLTVFLAVAMITIALIYAWNRALRQNVLDVDGRKLVYLLLVLIIGAGLVVNAGLKNHFGRARPRDVAEFGGTSRFSPAFVMTNQCRTNCSFSSGDAAGGFFALALVMALRRRPAWFVAAGAFGAVISLSRMASGAHFFSDTVASFFIMLIVADVLYHYLLERRPAFAGAADVTNPTLTSFTKP
jgi:lipid A 4'-phosphatase